MSILTPEAGQAYIRHVIFSFGIRPVARGAETIQERNRFRRGCPDREAAPKALPCDKTNSASELGFVVIKSWSSCRDCSGHLTIAEYPSLRRIFSADHACQHSAPRFGRSFFASYHAIGLPADAGGLYPRSSSGVATASVRMVCGLRGRRPFPIIPARPATSAPAYIPIQ
jgi:hypothetical protein